MFIRGRVQGVGFRNFTKERADELGVKGWVKNLLDKRVEAVMQGKSDAVEKLLESVRKGPRSGKNGVRSMAIASERPCSKKRSGAWHGRQAPAGTRCGSGLTTPRVIGTNRSLF